MIEKLDYNIIDLGERMSLLDTGTMFRFTSLGQTLHRGSSRRPRQGQPFVQPGRDQAVATTSGQKRDRSETEAE